MKSVFNDLFKDEDSLQEMQENLTTSFGCNQYKFNKKASQFEMENNIGEHKCKFLLKLDYEEPSSKMIRLSLDLKFDNEMIKVVHDLLYFPPTDETEEYGIEKSFWCINTDILHYMIEKVESKDSRDCRNWYLKISEAYFIDALKRIFRQMSKMKAA